jgi:perosamine synthetase
VRIGRTIAPAETTIPVSAFLTALLGKGGSFHNELSDYLGTPHCLLGSSGRALLALLLKKLKEKDKDGRREVLIPGYTCYSVASSVARAGLKIRVYDLDPSTFSPDLDSLRKAAHGRTLAVIAQHLFGIPTPLEGVREVARERGMYLIEDAAQALGGSVNGLCLGGQGDFGLYSFGRGKPLPLGCGGALTAKDGEILEQIEIKHQESGYGCFAAAAVTQVVSKPYLYWVAETLPLGLGETVFNPHFSISCMPGLMDGLGASAIKTLHKLNDHRRRIAMRYGQILADPLTVKTGENARAVYTRFPVKAGPKSISKELKQLGIRRMYPRAIADEEIIREHFADQGMSTPGASKIAQTLITLPTHSGIDEDLAECIALRVREAYPC